MARNVQQIMAFELLLDDDIKLVTLLGSAGTGKTLLALAAGMHKVFQGGALRETARGAADHAAGPRHRLPPRREGRKIVHVDAADFR
jgi:ABC-type taurine transport system ATPase subunit